MSLTEAIENTIEILVKEDSETKLDYLKAYGECSYILEILNHVDLDISDRQLKLYKNFIFGLKERSYQWIFNNYKVIIK